MTDLRKRHYDAHAGQFTQQDPIGLAGGLNLYGFASGDPINQSDPFGLCPPADANVADCANDNLGNAWRALDGAGKAGRAVIAGVVSNGITVSTRAFAVDDNCGLHACSVGGSFTLKDADASGVMAVGIAHEFGHFTESPSGNSKWKAADNELRAWDQSARVYRGLKAPFRGQAQAVFGDDFRTLQSQAGRAANRAVFACRADASSLGQSTASCAP